jgi:L-seryl-tRNA(Ser) seleniumtransferase
VPSVNDPSTADVNALLRRLPKVDEVLREEAARRLLEWAPRWAVVSAVRDEIESLRAALLSVRGAADAKAAEIVEGALEGRVEKLLRPSLVRVLNGTGVVLHTNLGRAPLAKSAVERIAEVARGYCNLEYRLDERRRGSRHDHVAALLTQLTGAEAALVVNNNAAAVLLGLGALAAGREVIVSRGELVEIGGSFRIPDVMRASGAKLVEVGTTNRTHPRDYEAAIAPNTALLLKVHQSNFSVVGFTAEVAVPDLVAIGRARGIPTMVDLGSGSLTSTGELGLAPEPTVAETVAAGADVVTFSGDKLLGGPQAGVILMRSHHLQALRAHPLLRAMRSDKLTLAGLEATLELHRDGHAREIPALAMLSTPREILDARASKLAALVKERAPHLEQAIVETLSAVGGGALPQSEPPSAALSIRDPRRTTPELDAFLRAGDPPLVARVSDDRLLIDVRTLTDGELPEVAAVLSRT